MIDKTFFENIHTAFMAEQLTDAEKQAIGALLKREISELLEGYQLGSVSETNILKSALFKIENTL